MRFDIQSHAAACMAVVAVVAGLAGCAGVDMSGFGIKPAEPGTQNGFSFKPGPAPVAAKAFIGSDIEGLFTKHPITDSNRPQTWPRVAITVVSAAPSIFKTTGVSANATVGAQDCATYNLKVWTSASQSKAYDGLRLCYGEVYQRMQRVPMVQVPTWGRRSFWAGERNTGSVRNDGPVPPTDHFPNDPAVQDLWLDAHKNTIAFVAAPLHVLGYNWNDINDKRVWFVSVPSR